MAYYVPTFRSQRPADDPKEPWPGETKARGDDHAWNNCVQTSGAMALDYHTRGARRLWGGDLRHHQSDRYGGTDLRDLAQAWSHIGGGYYLTPLSGKGFAAVDAAHDRGCAVVIQGIGNCPGVGTYTGGHAGIWLPDGRWGDPLTNRWQTGVPQSAIREWAQRLNPRIQASATRARSS